MLSPRRAAAAASPRQHDAMDAADSRSPGHVTQLAIAGPVADAFGIQTWFWIGGIACVLMGVFGLIIPAVMKIEEHEDKTQTVEEITGEVSQAALE